MTNLYYLFGYLNESITNVKNRSSFKYLENNVLAGDVITTIYQSDEIIKIKFNHSSTDLMETCVDISVNLNFITLIKSNFDGMIINKDDIENKDKYIHLNGKWKKIVCYSNRSCVGVSKMHDLFYINMDNPQSLKMEFFPFKIKIDTVACGSDHILILSTYPGRIFSKGLGSRGQLGHGDLENCETFKEISSLGSTAKQIACGFWHSVCLTEAGDVYSWGWNESGQLGVPCFSSQTVLEKHFKDTDILESPLTIHSTPILVQFPIDDWSITKISCGSRHTVCLNDDGRIYCFGWGGMGQLGMEDGASYDFPILIDGFIGTDILCTQWGTVVTVLPHPNALL